MTEQLLQFIWKHKYLLKNKLFTTQGDELEIINPGLLNQASGPDFIAGKIFLKGMTFVGNIEIHVKASDWNRHKHQFDKSYSNVILHVVWQNDCEIYLENGERIAALELKNWLTPSLILTYENLLHSTLEIPCAKLIGPAEIASLQWFYPRLVAEKLAVQNQRLLSNLSNENGHWDHVLKKQIGHYLGRKSNALPFELLFDYLPEQIWLKHQGDVMTFHAIFLGVAGFLNKTLNNQYNLTLKSEFTYYKKLYNLQSLEVSIWKYKGLRPPGFPSIRVLQFAEILSQSNFSLPNLCKLESLSEIKNLLTLTNPQIFDVGDLHPTHSNSFCTSIQLSEGIKNHLIINVIIPLIYTYGKYHQLNHLCERVSDWLSILPKEENNILEIWKKLGIKINNAEESQALIQLKNYYCTNKKCLECSIGNSIIKKSLP